MQLPEVTPTNQASSRQLELPTYFLQDLDKLHTETDTPYTMRVRDMDNQDRPRERMMRLGPAELSMAEVVAILLNTGTRREDVLAMSRRVLKEYGERAMLQETSPQRLSQTLDIPLSKACQLIAGFELGRRFYTIRSGRPSVVRTAKQAYTYLRQMGDLPKEHLRALYLGSRYQVVHEELVSVGSLMASIVHPREIYQPAITYGAAAVIIAHNHPSGSLEPTAADLDITAQLVEAGKLLGIELLDHLIIAGENYLSIMESND